MGRVRKVCINCGVVYSPRGSSTRCIGCEADRSKGRPWYQTPKYRQAQAEARNQTGRACPRCGTPMVGKHRPSVDHIKPIAAGGSWSGPFQIVCLVCNISKSNRVDTP